jgi:hypothetical protein
LEEEGWQGPTFPVFMSDCVAGWIGGFAIGMMGRLFCESLWSCNAT